MTTCQQCAKTFTAKRSDAKYCGSTCRNHARLARINGTPVLSVVSTAPAAGLLTDATRSELGHLADTADGILLLTLAARIDAVPETSPALSSLSKEYAARKTEMLSRSHAKADPFDELQALRARRRA